MGKIFLIFIVLILHSLFVWSFSLRLRFAVSSSKGPNSFNRHYFKKQNKSNDVHSTQPIRLTQTNYDYDLYANKHFTNKDLLAFDDVMSIIKEDDSAKLSDMIKQGRVRVGMMKDDDSKATILTEACELRSLGCIKVLLNNWAGFDTYNSEGHDPFTNACIKSDIELIKLIIKESFMNTDPDIVDHWIVDCFGDAEIMYNNEVTTLLLSYLTDINVFSNHNGNSLLHCAVEYNHINMVHTLLDRGIDREAENDSSNTALLLASVYEQIDIVKLLLSYNSTINKTTTMSIYSILDALDRVSFSRKNIKVIRILTDYIPDSDSDSLMYAFHTAVEAQHAGMVKLLLKRGVDVNAVYEGRTALSYSRICYWSPEGDPAVYPSKYMYCMYSVYPSKYMYCMYSVYCIL